MMESLRLICRDKPPLETAAEVLWASDLRSLWEMSWSAIQALQGRKHSVNRRGLCWMDT